MHIRCPHCQNAIEVVQETERNILSANGDLKEIVIESGHMAETLFERVNDGYRDLTDEIKGLSNVEQVNFLGNETDTAARVR